MKLGRKIIIEQLTSGRTLVLLDQALVSGGNFALGVLLARWLGLEIFGMFSLLWMGVLFVLSLHQAFISQPLVTLFANKDEEGKVTYFNSVFQLQLLISLGLIVLCIIAYLVIDQIGLNIEWLTWVPIMGCITALFLLQDTLRKLYFVKKEFRHPFLMDGLLYVLLFAVLISLHFAGMLSLFNALVVVLISYLVSCSVGIIQFINSQKASKGKHLKFKHSDPFKFEGTTLHSTLNEHYHFSFWLLGTSLLQWFSGNFFLIAAAGVLGAVAVGALRMAQNMVGLCHVLFLAMENIVPAEAARQFFNHGKEKMNAYLLRISLLGSIPFLLMLFGLSLVSPLLIEFLYGAEYLPYAYLVWAYSLLYIFVYIGYPLRFSLRTIKLTSPIFIAYCFCSGASLLLAFPVTRAWGMSGVMAGLIAMQILMIGVYIYFLTKKKASEAVLINES